MGNKVSLAVVIDRIRSYRKKHGIAPSRLAVDAKVAESSLRAIDKPSWNPTRRTLERLEALIDARQAAAANEDRPAARSARPTGKAA